MRELTYERVNPFTPAGLSTVQRVFRAAPGFVYPTEGRPATDEEVAAMVTKLPGDVTALSLFVYVITSEDELCGCSVTARGYPTPESAYLALLLLTAVRQGQSLGRQALRRIEQEAKAWGCNTLVATVDSKNEGALRFWLREGFVEQSRKAAPGFMGDAVRISKDVL